MPPIFQTMSMRLRNVSPGEITQPTFRGAFGFGGTCAGAVSTFAGSSVREGSGGLAGGGPGRARKNATVGRPSPSTTPAAIRMDGDRRFIFRDARAPASRSSAFATSSAVGRAAGSFSSARRQSASSSGGIPGRLAPGGGAATVTTFVMRSTSVAPEKGASPVSA